MTAQQKAGNLTQSRQARKECLHQPGFLGGLAALREAFFSGLKHVISSLLMTFVR